MSSTAWEMLTGPVTRDDSAWEMFHENSKATPYEPFLAEAVAAAYAQQIPESLAFEGYSEVSLPEVMTKSSLSIDEAMDRRSICDSLEPCSVTLETAAKLLRFGYGVAGDTRTEGARQPRTVYSAGSLFPLEIFLYSARVAGLSSGFYHYNPIRNNLRLLRGGDQSQRLAPTLMDGRIAQTAALMIFIAAMPERSVLRYGDRGYRFTLLEAGAAVQNINLIAGSLGLGCVNVGEYFDRQIDDLLNLDGLTISTLFLIGIGKRAGEEAARGGRSGA
jgi:SagB-type dehydrogenase family enzyme